MGQAKQRGSYEQRKAEGEAKRAAEQARRMVLEVERAQAEAARRAAMTPEQRALEIRSRTILASILGMVQSSSERGREIEAMLRDYRDSQP